MYDFLLLLLFTYCSLHPQNEAEEEGDSGESDEYQPSDMSEAGGEESGSEDSDEDYTSIDEDESESRELVVVVHVP